MDFSARIDEHGWRQGSFLPPELIASASPIGGAPILTSDGCLHVVVTQSCDLVNKKIEDEPWCEVLCLRPIPKLLSFRENGRNPRFLHLPVQQNGITSYFEAAAKDRLFLPRKALEMRPPLTTIEIDNRYLEVLTDWLAKRYTRPAFPNNFNHRLKAQESQLKRLLDEGHGLFRGFYLRMNDYGELSDDKPYRIKLLLVAHVEALKEQETDVAQIAKALEGILGKCGGIEVVEVLVLSENQTSLKTTDDYLPWNNFDYLSVRDED